MLPFCLVWGACMWITDVLEEKLEERSSRNTHTHTRTQLKANLIHLRTQWAAARLHQPTKAPTHRNRERHEGLVLRDNMLPYSVALWVSSMRSLLIRIMYFRSFVARLWRLASFECKLRFKKDSRRSCKNHPFPRQVILIHTMKYLCLVSLLCLLLLLL